MDATCDTIHSIMCTLNRSTEDVYLWHLKPVYQHDLSTATEKYDKIFYESQTNNEFLFKIVRYFFPIIHVGLNARS